MIKTIILEYLREEQLDKLILEMHANEIRAKYYPNVEQNVFDDIMKADTTSSNFERGKLGRYAKWLLNLYTKNNLNLNDLPKASNYISIFDRLLESNRLKVRDINRYYTLDDMYDVVEPYVDTNKPISNREKREEGTKRIYEDNRFLVIQPLTKESSIQYGKGTTWCTASTDIRNNFYGYNESGPLYIIMDKTQRNDVGDYVKYQIHFQENEFMNDNNKKIDFNANPEIKDVIKKIIKIEKFNDVDLIEMNPNYIMFIDNPTEQIQIKVINQNGELIKHIKNPSEYV